jgi:ribosome-associated protein
MIKITDDLYLNEDEIQYTFVRASGPGGQKINKTASGVQLRFDVVNSPSLPKVLRERVILLAGKKVTDSGILIIEAKRFRTQKQNRKDAMERLIELIREASKPEKKRKPSIPTRASKERRLRRKRRTAERKRLRRRIKDYEE